MVQHPLLNLEEIFDRPLKKYELFFSAIDLLSLDKSSCVERKPISRSAIVRALIFKNLKSISSLSDLCAELYERPTLSQILGFEPGDRPIPVERFSCFLKDTDNKILQQVRVSLVKNLISLEVIKGKYLSVDSCPILANLKENNLKTNVKSRFKKERPHKNDRNYRIGIFPTFVYDTKRVYFFWG